MQITPTIEYIYNCLKLFQKLLFREKADRYTQNQHIYKACTMLQIIDITIFNNKQLNREQVLFMFVIGHSDLPISLSRFRTWSI